MENGNRRRVYALEGDTTEIMMLLATQNRAHHTENNELLKTRDSDKKKIQVLSNPDDLAPPLYIHDDPKTHTGLTPA